MAAMARVPVVPEATPAGALSAAERTSVENSPEYLGDDSKPSHELTASRKKRSIENDRDELGAPARPSAAPDIGTEGAVAAFNGNAIFIVFLPTAMFINTSADVATLGGGLLSGKPTLQAADVTP